MVILLTTIHVLVCFFLIIVVLLQSGKAADLAGAFGGMGSQTAFGPRGSATALSRATTVAAAIFMVTSLTLAVITTRQSGGTSSVLDGQKKSAPIQPAKPSVTIPQNGKGETQTIPLPLPGNNGQGQQAPATPAKK